MSLKCLTLTLFATILVNWPITAHALPATGGVYFTTTLRVDGDPDSVFNWTEVPANQEVVITRASFDKGGYQLYDTVGETIVVPFKNHDLYAMKFARSDNGTMYFVNTGGAPVLYVPDGGYLENAGDPGAKWYPFSKRFHPDTPVYESIAPSWSAYDNMGWYPNMAYYGGYWCPGPVFDPGIFVELPGFSILIGGTYCFGWWPYNHYCGFHSAPFHTAFWDPGLYGFAGRPLGGRHFGGRAYGAPYGRSAAWSHSTFGGRAVAARGPMRSFHGTSRAIAQSRAAHGGAAGRGAGAGTHTAMAGHGGSATHAAAARTGRAGAGTHAGRGSGRTASAAHAGAVGHHATAGHGAGRTSGHHVASNRSSHRASHRTASAHRGSGGGGHRYAHHSSGGGRQFRSVGGGHSSHGFGGGGHGGGGFRIGGGGGHGSGFHGGGGGGHGGGGGRHH